MDDKKTIRKICVLILLLLSSAQLVGAAYEPFVVVSDPYIDLRTGPGRGFPVFHVVEQNEQIQLVKRKTDWIKIRTLDKFRAKEGWVHVKDMHKTLDIDGKAIQIPIQGIEQFRSRNWTLGFNGGDLDGVVILMVFVSYYVIPRISAQLSATQILGNFTDGYMGNVNLTLSPFPEWRVSPFFTLGTGIIHTKPQTTVVQAEDRTDEIMHVGLGTAVYLTQRFVFRMEYKRHTILSSRKNNEEINEWKAGFSIFF